MPATSRPERAELEMILQGLRSQPGLRLALLVAPDGLLIAGAAAGDEAEEMWGAVSAVLTNLGGQITKAEGAGDLETAVFYTDDCRLLVARAKLGFLLAVADPQANLEQLSAEVAQAGRSCDVRTESLLARRRGNDDV
jgi:predicted regulator of Ras-like GTPase activity (Roadblock/LC7/MglB family)